MSEKSNPVPRNMSPTVRDVAHRAGVSVATVSRVLNRPAVVAAHTKKKVLAAISLLGFSPNLAAASLRRGHGIGRDGRANAFEGSNETRMQGSLHKRTRMYRECQMLRAENRELKRVIRRFGRDLKKWKNIGDHYVKSQDFHD